MASKSQNPSLNGKINLDHIPRNDKDMETTPTSTDELKKLIDSLELNKGPGIDGINSYIIKKTRDVIAPKLVHLFNSCIDVGKFPNKLKTAKIIPLHKGGSKTNPTNYRPISLLPQFGKLFEKIIKERIVAFLVEYNIITDHQYGFRKLHSTELAITDIQNKLLQNLDDNKITCTIFLDLAKAFDCVDHEILLRKLERYGIRGKTLLLIESYLSNRYHLTKVNGVESNLKLLEIGVPQGSILGPLLFILFINDLPRITNFSVKLFADDTFLSLEDNDLKTLQNKTNTELKKISRWFSANKLTLNVTKSQYMIVKRNNNKKSLPNFTLKFNGKKMDRCSSYKYLGVHLDDKLNWKKHINYLCEKLSKMCGFFAKLRHCCNIILLKTIYYALVESHLQYCNMIWGNADTRVLEPLVKLQTKLIRIMCFISRDEDRDIDQVFKNLGILKLTQLNKLTTAKFMYKYKNGLLPNDNFTNFFKAPVGNHRYPLRNRRNQDFQFEWAKTTFGMKKLQCIGVQIWNEILPEIRNSNSLREFKSKFKKFQLN